MSSIMRRRSGFSSAIGEPPVSDWLQRPQSCQRGEFLWLITYPVSFTAERFSSIRCLAWTGARPETVVDELGRNPDRRGEPVFDAPAPRARASPGVAMLSLTTFYSE